MCLFFPLGPNKCTLVEIFTVALLPPVPLLQDRAHYGIVVAPAYVKALEIDSALALLLLQGRDYFKDIVCFIEGLMQNMVHFRAESHCELAGLEVFPQGCFRLELFQGDSKAKPFDGNSLNLLEALFLYLMCLQHSG